MNRFATFCGMLILAAPVAGCSDGGSQPQTGAPPSSSLSAGSAPASAVPQDANEQQAALETAEVTPDPAKPSSDVPPGGAAEPDAAATTSARNPSEPSALRSLGRALLKGFADSP